MKYWWHSHKYGYTDASKFTWTFVKTKRGKVEKNEEEHINKEKHKDVTFDCL